MSAHVYFIRRSDGEGPIKIGSTRFLDQRLGSLMAWSPEPLRVLATIPGDVRRERQFHSMLASFRLHYEWFAPATEVLEVVEQVQRGAFDVSRLHNYSDRPRRRAPDLDARRIDDLRLVRELNRLTKAARVSHPPIVLRAKSEIFGSVGARRLEATAIIRGRISDLMASEMLAFNASRAA